MLRKKYMSSYGLAFFEDRDMKKLSKKASQGWHLKKFRFAGYELEKGSSDDVIYNIDYRKIQPDEEHEYFELFAYGGWTHVCSSTDMHIFKAKPGTTPIYSDIDSSIDKLARLAKSVNMVTSIALAVTLVLWMVMIFTTGSIQKIAQACIVYSLIISVPAMMTSGAVYYHMWKNMRLKSNHSS